MEIDEKEYQALDSLRRKRISVPAHEIMESLAKYFPMGTKVIITKDCWKMEKDGKNY